MMDEQFPQKDAAVSNWLDSKGLPVTERHHDPYSEMNAWRSHAVKPITTLYITRNVCDDYTPDELVGWLERFKVQQTLSQSPKKYTILRRSKAGPPELVQLDEIPK